MKHPKPGFKIFLKTRLMHPIAANDKLEYISASGKRYQDVGSLHTVLFLSAIGLTWITTFFTLNFTLLGRFFVAVPLLLHRFLRYFWTDFKRLDGEGNEILDASLLHLKKRSRISSTIYRGFNAGGLYEDEEIKYCRYNGRQKALLVLETVLVLALVFGISINPFNLPYYKFYQVTSKTIALDQDQKNLITAYKTSRAYIDEVCPEAELIDYAIFSEQNETGFYFIFQNPMRGVLLNKVIGAIWIQIHTNGKVLDADFFGGESEYNVFEEPIHDVNSEKIIEIVLSGAKLTKDKLSSYYIGTRFIWFDSTNLTDPGGDTWAVEITAKDKISYYTVDLKKGVAIREE